MIDFYLAYRPLFDLFLIHSGYTLSQYIVLRAGVFSLAPAGLAAVGAYAAAIATVKLGFHPALSLIAATGTGILAAMLLSWPLARLRGVFQAIATLAFVQIVVSLNLYAESLTGGAMGFNGIPKTVGTGTLFIAALLVLYLIHALAATRIGRAFDAIRQDEAVAASLGISVTVHQALAFGISGAIAGLFGGLEAFHSHALEPGQFGFGLVVALLSYVVLGGRRSVFGPLVGVAVLVALPELARPLAENRQLVYGLLLIFAITYLPHGLLDTFLQRARQRKIARLDDSFAGKKP